MARDHVSRFELDRRRWLKLGVTFRSGRFASGWASEGAISAAKVCSPDSAEPRTVERRPVPLPNSVAR